MSERSGIHVTAEDSGWPVAAPAEPDPHKDGTGADPFPSADAVVNGVVAASLHQTITLVAIAAHTWTLTLHPHDGGADETTAAIAPAATGPTVQAALEALASCDPGDVTVTGPAGGPYDVKFHPSIYPKLWTEPVAQGVVEFVDVLTGSTTSPSKVVVTDPHHSG